MPLIAPAHRQCAVKLEPYLHRDKAREGRGESRVPARIEMHLRKANGSEIGEILYTENISSGGAAFFASTRWHPGEKVLVKALRVRFIAEGQIVYCRPAHDGKFAVGLRMISREGDWVR